MQGVVHKYKSSSTGDTESNFNRELLECKYGEERVSILF